MYTIHARAALTDAGWLGSARIRIGDDGLIDDVSAGEAAPGDHQLDLLVPGMPNAHCHAFQRGIAGLTEAAGGSGIDSFWTWRERMYQALQGLDARALEETALALYQGLRARGYTSVAEFHYVHRLGGSSAEDTADALVQAAAAAGLRLLLLPVLYRRGGLDGSALSARQAGFQLDLDSYGGLLEKLRSAAVRHPHLTLGIAPHSLRSVSADDLTEALKLRQAIIPGCPVHIHISEQEVEVEEARLHLGTTPIDWLCEHAPVDGSWVLVHATHATDHELLLARKREAVICICTTTEANLGDGAFEIERWWQLGGSLAVGSDSNVCLDPLEELRWLEYQARLRRQRRARLLEAGSLHPGTSLWIRAVAGGRRAMGWRSPGIGAGAPAELLAVTVSDPSLSPDEAMDDLVFAQRTARLEPVPGGSPGGPKGRRSANRPGRQEAGS